MNAKVLLVNRPVVPHSVLDVLNRNRPEERVECPNCGLNMDRRGLCGGCGVGSA